MLGHCLPPLKEGPIHSPLATAPSRPTCRLPEAAAQGLLGSAVAAPPPLGSTHPSSKLSGAGQMEVHTLPPHAASGRVWAPCPLPAPGPRCAGGAELP